MIKKIADFSIDLDWNCSFSGKSKGNQHLFRVSIIARFLAEQEFANIDIALAGAWLHDVGLAYGDINHSQNGVIIADKLLTSFSLNKHEKNKFCSASNHTKAPSNHRHSKLN